MFSFMKNTGTVRRPGKSKNSAQIDAVKKTLNSILISEDCLKQMGIKSLFVDGLKVKKSMSFEDAVNCLNTINAATDKIVAFSEKFNDMADEVNVQINNERAAAVAGKCAMPKTNAFYTVDNIVNLFNEITKNVETEKKDPETLNNAIISINVALKIFYIKADIALTMIDIKASSVGITIQK